MESMKYVVLLLTLMTCMRSIRSAEDLSFFDKGYRMVSRIYDECQHQTMGLTPCLKKKAITFFDRLVRINSIPIFENMELVRNGNGEPTTHSDQDLENLGRTGGTREEALNNILFDKMTSLMNGFNVQVRLPKMTTGDLKRSIEEGRGKMKKMMGMMMMGLAMKMAALIPLAIGVLFLLAGKALIISKIALVLSLIIGLKKLLSQKQGGNDSHHGGWQQGGGGGGWDRSMRSLNPSGVIDLDPAVVTPEGFKLSTESFAQNLAYKGQIGVTLKADKSAP